MIAEICRWRRAIFVAAIVLGIVTLFVGLGSGWDTVATWSVGGVALAVLGLATFCWALSQGHLRRWGWRGEAAVPEGTIQARQQRGE